MNPMNEEIIRKILTVDEPNAEFTILKWYTNNVVDAGSNITSEVSRLTIEYVNDCGKNVKKHIFVKIPLTSALREFGAKMRMYYKEMTMYTRVLPQIYNINAAEYFAPKCYHVEENHSLFLEDLTQSGYGIANRHRRLDFDHCYHALKGLAKLHGLSVKLDRTCGILENVGEEFCFIKKYEDDHKVLIQGLTKFYHHLDSNVRKKYSKEMEILKRVSFDEIIEDMKPGGTSFNVLNHGDFWTNNILFKYDKYGIVEDVKFVDFQLCRYTSPVLDLIYFTIGSMRFEVFDEHFDLLLNVYLDTLNKVLQTLDCGIYTMDSLRNDMSKKYRYAVFVLTSLLPFMACEHDNPIADDVLETYREEHYSKIATQWFLHFVEKDIFGFKVNSDEVLASARKATPTI